MQKGHFLVCFFFCFLVVLFFVACVLVLVFCKKGPERLFSCNFRGFLSILFPQKACLKVFLFFLFCFFCFCLPFQNSILSLCFLAISPFWKTLIFLVSFFFFFLLFPFLMFACFFQTNFPNIPFLKSNLLFVFGCFFSVVLVFVLVVYVSAFLFFCCYAGFVFGVFLVLFCVLFLSSFLFGFQSMKKVVFPASSVFWVLLVKRVVWFYVLCFLFLFLFVCLVSFLSILKNSFVLFCFCVVFLWQD